MTKYGRVQGIVSLGAIISCLILLVILFIQANDDPEVSPGQNDPGRYMITSVPLPDRLDFAGEMTPLENFDVREALDRELLVNAYWQSHTLLLIKRSNRYFPVIEKILEENGIPEDFKYLPVAESDLMNLVSPANAVGFWQFRRATALEQNLEVNNEVDERYHLEKSTQAACEFLKHSYELYGSWTMAAASYNAGRKGLNDQIGRQGTEYYYDLLLNEETGRYIYRILALKLIMSDPELYGFSIDDEELYPPIPTYKVTVDTTIRNLAEFATRYSINYKVLKVFNPWLRETTLTNRNGKTYYISIPEKGYRDFIPLEETTAENQDV